VTGGLLLFDGNACAARAYYAVSPRLGTKGRFRSAAHGLIGLVLKLVRSEDPSYAAVLLEEPVLLASELRRQLPQIRQFLRLAGIPVIQQPGCSIPQLAAALILLAKPKGIPTTLVSTRVSMLPLVGPEIILVNPARDGLRFDPERVMELYGVPPSQISDWLNLVGDESERIPGVKGVGPKTAAKLLKQFGSLSRLRASLDQLPLPIRKRIGSSLSSLRPEQSGSPARFPSGLDLSLESCRFSRPDPTLVTKAFTRAGMTDLLPHLVPHRHPRPVRHQVVLTEDQLVALEDRLHQVDRFAVDTETTGLDPARSKLVGISFGVERDVAFYVPLGHTYPGAPDQLPLELILERLGPILADPAKMKIGQNLKFDLHSLHQAGFSLRGPIFDTMVASYLLHPDRRSHSLDALSLDYLGYKMIPIKELIGTGKTMAEVEIPTVTEYACEDADVTFQLYQLLSKELGRSSLNNLFIQWEMPLLLALAAIEGRGVLIDRELAQELLNRAGERVQELAEEIFNLAGRRFDLGSPKEIRGLLKEHLGLVLPFHTRTKRVSIRRDSLQAVVDRHPIVGRIIRYQDWVRFAKEKLTLLCERVDPVTGRFHLGYHQAATGTGQIRVGRFFLMPEDREMEDQLCSIVAPPPGFTLLKAVYLEPKLSLMTHWFGEDVKQAFQRWIIQAKREAQVSTLLGRSRKIPQLNSPNTSLREAAEKEAVATLLEGSVADLLKCSIVRVFQALQEASRDSRIVLLFQEGLLLEIPQEDLARVAPLVKRTMEGVFSLRVPLTVRLLVGSHLSSLSPHDVP